MNRTEHTLHRRHCRELLAQGPPVARVAECTASGTHSPHTRFYNGTRLWLTRSAGLPKPHPPRPGVPNSSGQWVGVHEHLVITYQRPQRWDNLLQISLAVPALEPFGRVIWLGRCLITLGVSSRTGKREAPYICIPSSTWLPPEPWFRDQRLKLSYLIRTVPLPALQTQALFLEFPTLTRDLFDVSIL